MQRGDIPEKHCHIQVFTLHRCFVMATEEHMKTSKTGSDVELVKIKKRMGKLQAELSKLQALMSQQPPPPLPSNPRMSQWVLVREYFQTVGGNDTPKKIAQALVHAGHDLVKYPLRNVKICVTSPFLRNIFNVYKDNAGEETVSLIGKSIQYAPSTHRSRK